MTSAISCRMCGADSGTFTAVRDVRGAATHLCEYCLDHIRRAGMIEPTNGQRSIRGTDNPVQLTVPIVSWERGQPYPAKGNPKPAA